MGEMRNAYNILVGKIKWALRRISEDDNKMHVGEIASKCVNWIKLDQGRIQ
jgi:hypothetical protein